LPQDLVQAIPAAEQCAELSHDVRP
jgi:hypothetical protein